jgi:ribonuclease HII
VKTGIPAIDDARNTCICGSDEVGLGAWAGPAVVCAVAAFCEWFDPEVTDSKKMTRKARERIYEKYWGDDRLVISLVVVPVEDIDKVGVHRAVLDGHRQAIEGTYWRLVYPPVVVVDGNQAPEVPGVICLPKADLLVPAVSLASIIAKVTRDRLMADLDKQYPGYDLTSNCGYGTSKHQLGLARLGVSPIHRRSFAPIARLLEGNAAADVDVMAHLATLPQE